MKKIFQILILIGILTLIGCNKRENQEIIDLTNMNSVMADSYLANMINKNTEYIGKTIKVKGTYIVSENSNGQIYHVCLFQSTCCPNGIEFITKNNEYPSINTPIIVQGKFNKYEEINNDRTETYFNLIDSSIN